MTWHPDIPAEYRNQIVTGDARELARALPDESVDLIFTDPVYDRIEDYAWLAETAARVLKLDGHLLVWQGQPWLPQTIAALTVDGLRWRWLFARYRTGGRDPRYAFGWCKWMPLLWYSKGDGLPTAIPDLLIEQDNGTVGHHAWQKPVGFSLRLTSAFTKSDSIVWEPFTGGGTVPAVCKMLNRNYIAFEIDEQTAERARTRVEQTQAMSPVLLGVQEPMELAV